MSKGARASEALILEAMHSGQTREALRVKARKVQSSAEAIANAEDVQLDSKLSEGLRPQGRPYARVESTNVAQEYGDSKTERRRVLGRAAEANR